MAAGTAQVGTLRVRSAAGDTPAVRLAAGAWLGGAELHPGALPPSAVLIVRRMADPLPGKLPTGGPAPPDPAWERAARGSLDGFCRRAARPTRGPVPPGAEAVLFADEAEMLACLALDLAAGSALGCWWWALVLRRLGAWDLPRLLMNEPARVPALLHHLAQRGHAAEVFGRLSEAEAMIVLDAVARAYEAPELAKALISPAGRAGILPAAGKGGKPAPEHTATSSRPRTRPIGSPQPAWQQRLLAIPDVTRLAPANRVLLAAVLALFEEPARARSAAFAAEVRVWWEAGAILTHPESHDDTADARVSRISPARRAEPSPPVLSHPHSHPSGEGAPPPSENRVWQEPSRRLESPPPDLQSDQTRPLPGGRDARPEDRGESRASSEVRPASNGEVGPPSSAGAPAIVSPAGARQGAEPVAAQPAELTGEVEGETADDVPFLDFEEGVATEIAGLFYLINLMTSLDIPDGFEEDWHLASEVGAWGVLEAIARALLGPDAGHLAVDPVWRVLALLAGRDPDEPPGADHPWLAFTLPHLRLRLAQGLGLDPARPEELPPLLLLHPGQVHVTSTHVDVVMDLATVAVPVRVSGLDRDPGWLPAFGRVIQFHFR